MRVGVVYNLKRHIITDPPDAEAEFDDGETINAIANALESAGHRVALFEADTGLFSKLVEDRPDIAFNIAEGTGGRGRESRIPAILNYIGIPFTGSDETAMCLTMDKSLAKRILSTYGINTPASVLVRANAPAPDGIGDLNYPLIVKPNAEGSGKGITELSVVNDVREARKALAEALRVYKQDMLVEEYIEGREFTVGILGNGENARAFTPMELIFKDAGRNIYGYETKRRFREFVDYKCPPDAGGDKLAELTDTALKIFDILGCADLARIDFRMDARGRVYFIELNPLPGLAPGYSDYPMLAEFCGVGYDGLINGILDAASARYQLINV